MTITGTPIEVGATEETVSTIAESISENAISPRVVTSDGFTVEQPNLRDQIKADEYISGKNARLRKDMGVIFRKITPPGTVC